MRSRLRQPLPHRPGSRHAGLLVVGIVAVGVFAAAATWLGSAPHRAVAQATCPQPSPTPAPPIAIEPAVAYLRPPTAEEECLPDSQRAERIEGHFEGLPFRLSLDPSSALSTWTVRRKGPSGNVIEEFSTEVPRPLFVAPAEGDYEIHAALADGTVLTRTVEVHNTPPLGHALDVEAVLGGDVSFFGRFLDPGWLDQHSARWRAGAAEIALAAGTGAGDTAPGGVIEESHRAALGAGTTRARVPVADVLDSAAPPAPGMPATVTGSLTVTDDGGGSREAPFAITIYSTLPLDRHEPNDDVATLGSDAILRAGGRYLSFIAVAGDLDYFEVVPRGEGSAPPPPYPSGAEVLVSLTGAQLMGADERLPADLDLAIYVEHGPGAFSGEDFDLAPFESNQLAVAPAGGVTNAGTAPFQMTPFQMTPLQVMPFQVMPFQMTPFQMTPFQMTPFQMTPFQMTPFQMTPFQMTPLSVTAIDELSGRDFGAGDVDPNGAGFPSVIEIGSGGTTRTLELAGLSARDGGATEQVLTRLDTAASRVFVAVRARSAPAPGEPYALQLEVAIPWEASTAPAVTALRDAVPGCTPASGAAIDPAGVAAHSIAHEPSAAVSAAGVRTLFITQVDRITTVQSERDGLRAQLAALADAPAVAGRVIEIDPGEYERWAPCSVADANGLAVRIKRLVEAQRVSDPSVRYVVLVGGDHVVPHYRMPDATVIGNERLYMLSSQLGGEQAVAASIAGGYTLTDDFYVDSEPHQHTNGRTLYLPEIAIGRLVERASEIGAAIDAFTSSSGQLDTSTALGTGYDFFRDGAAVALAALGGGTALLGPPNAQVAGSPVAAWTVDNLRCEWLEQCPASTGPHAVALINAHFTHFAALSAKGWEDFELALEAGNASAAEAAALAEALAVSDVPQAVNLERRVVFSMGCHAGLNVRDGDTAAVPARFAVEHDFAQRLGGAGAIFVASTGFAYGETNGIAGTEGVMVQFARLLAEGDRSAGEVLAEAKRRYILSLLRGTAYDEKSVASLVFYGLPHYGVSPHLVTDPIPVSRTPAASGIAGVTASRVSINLSSFTRVTRVTAAGAYHTFAEALGDHQATAGRPIQPRLVLPAGLGGEPAARGVLIESPTKYVSEGNWDPVIARPTHDWEVGDAPEPARCQPTFWPETIARINTVTGAAGSIEQALVVVPGQFRCDGSPQRGEQLRYTEINLLVLYSAHPDTRPPVIRGVHIGPASGGAFPVTVDATDGDGGSGIAKTRVVALGPGGVTFVGDVAGGIACADVADARGLIVQVVDGAGNVTTATSRGALYPTGCPQSLSLKASPSRIAAAGGTTTVTATVRTAAGAAVPDGTTVDFATSLGSFATGATTTCQTVRGACSVTLVGGGAAGSAIVAAVAGSVARTIQVTVTGTAPSAEDGTFDRPLPDVGVNTAVWNGGTVQQLATAAAAAGGISATVFVDGEAVVLIPGAPAFVNAAFTGDLVPAGTIVLVVR